MTFECLRFAGALFTAYLAVLATLRLEFARTTAFALGTSGLSSMATPVILWALLPAPLPLPLLLLLLCCTTKLCNSCHARYSRNGQISAHSHSRSDAHRW